MSNLINKIIKSKLIDSNKISDGYHTFHELYEQRALLLAALLNKVQHDTGCICTKAKKHSDGTMFENMFLVYAGLPSGEISFHIEMNYWDFFGIEEVEHARPWNGDTTDDVMQNLIEFCAWHSH